MGLYDSIQQTPTNPAASVNGTSAQKAPMDAYAQKMQKRANPMMRPQSFGQGAPMGQMGQAAAGLMNAYQGRSNPTAGQIPGMQGGSRDMMQAKQLALKNQTAAASGGAIGGSYNQLLSAHPQLQSFRDTGTKSGQDMSWMDKPGALSMAPPAQADEQRPQYGMQDVASRIAAARQPVPEQQSPMAAAAEQMRGYEGPDLGSQDPRELARMGQMGQLSGTTGQAPQPGLVDAPYGGEQPGSNGFQSMMAQMGAQRPDVMPRGLGPSYMGADMQNPSMQMDENGLEARRGPR